MRRNPIIVALDALTTEQSLSLAAAIAPFVWGFKVNDLLVAEGVSIIERLKKFGNVFADPKLFDIPNTVKNSVKTLERAGADLITIHASGGRAMIEEAVAASGRAKILCVTVLTSFSDEGAFEVYGAHATPQVLKLASLSVTAGTHGIVCSPQELIAIKDNPITKNLLCVTPGVRPSWHGTPDDQTRVATPKEALKRGAEFLVIGRPITHADDPVAAAMKVFDEIQG